MTPQFVLHALWLGGTVVQALLAVALLTRKSWQQFPVFTSYVIFNLAESAIAYLVHTSKTAYIYTYIVGETISVGLGLALVYEIFRHLFQPYPALRRLATMLFRIAGVLLLVLAGAVIYMRSPFDTGDVLAALLVVEQAARIMEVGFIVFLFLFSSVFGLHWRQLVFGIAVGFGVYVTVKLAEVTLLPHVPGAAVLLALTEMSVFDVALLAWLAYTMAPERITQTVELPTAQLERWNQAIVELIHQ